MTNGKRKESVNGELWLAPGEYGVNPKDGKWYARPPNSDVSMGCLENHDVEEHEDGTITVSPSILITQPEPVSPILWHGHLIRGKWNEA